MYVRNRSLFLKANLPCDEVSFVLKAVALCDTKVIFYLKK